MRKHGYPARDHMDVDKPGRTLDLCRVHPDPNSYYSIEFGNRSGWILDLCRIQPWRRHCLHLLGL